MSIAPAMTEVSRIKEGMSYQLRCEILSGSPREGNISWYHAGSEIRDGGMFQISETGHILILQDVSNETSGHYCCILNNGVSGGQCSLPYIVGK